MLGAAALPAVRDGGAFVAVTGPSTPQSERGIRVGTVHVVSESDALARLATLAVEGVLTPRVAETYPIEKASDAYAAIEAGGVRGAIVIVP